MKQWYFLGAFVLIGFSTWLTFAYTRTSTPQNIVITRTERGFEPADVSIQKGGTVTFVSNTGNEFWPASDSHPSHGLYPEFDPKRALKSDETWPFQMNVTGNWSFHDHLESTAHGVIRVTGDRGESLATCLQENGSPVANANCWAVELIATIQKKGLDAALDQFVEFSKNDPVFLSSCHDVMHGIGKEAYKQFAKDNSIVVARPETTYCGYGFYHGFIEEMLVQKGNGTLADVRTYCEQLLISDKFQSEGSAKRAGDACYHGIGHALFDALPDSLWGDDEKMVTSGVLQCEVVMKNEPTRALCASGIYNSLANAYLSGSYELSFRENDPLYICKTQKENYRDFCYKELATAYVWYKNLEYQEALSFIRTNTRENRDETLFAFFDDYIRHKMANPSPSQVAPLCAALTETNEKRSCIKGALFAFTASGEPDQEYKRMIDICTLQPVKSAERMYCFSETGVTLKALYPLEKAREICEQLAVPDRAACNG